MVRIRKRWSAARSKILCWPFPNLGQLPIKRRRNMKKIGTFFVIYMGVVTLSAAAAIIGGIYNNRAVEGIGGFILVFAISLLSVWREVRSYENKLDPLGKIQMALILSVSACLLGLISVAV